MSLTIASEFCVDAGVRHVNHAAVAPWPRRAVEAVTRFAQENAEHGSERYALWLAVERRLRERLARLIATPDAGDIALTKNTSEALSVIAYGIDWRAGDNVVGIVQEFPSNRIVWESLATRGVGWRPLDIDRCDDPESGLLGLCDRNTRLIAVSWVQYARGLRLDLARIGAFCRRKGILFCVDGIQGLGALPFDINDVDADFVVADGHKWMLGPEGVALLYVRPALREALQLHQFGWHMVEEPGDYERREWAPAKDARRFECGSPNLLGIHALEASLSLLEEVGLDAVWKALRSRVDYTIEQIDRAGYTLLTPRDPDRRAGIVTFSVPGTAPEALHRALMAHRVLCAPRGGGIRFSPHFYTPFEVIEGAFRVVSEVAGASRS